MKKSTLASLAALLGYSIFGFSFLFSKIALELTTPFVLLSVRFLAAFLVMNLLVLSGKMKISLKGKPVKMLLMLGLAQPIVYYICENYGISMTSSSFAGVMLGIVPVVGLVTGRVFLKERCTAFQVVCAVMSVVGVAMTTTGGMGNISVLGTILLLAAAVSSSLFSVISRGSSKYFTAFERTYVMFALASVVFTGIALVQNRHDLAGMLAPLAVPRFWVAALYLAVASSVCAFLLINYAMNHISVARAAIFANFATVISVPAGILIMQESFAPLQIVGIVIIMASVFGVSWPGKEK